MENLELNIKNEMNEINQPGFFSRVIGIIVSPAEIMKALIEKPRILFPILSAAFGTVIFYLARFQLYQEFINKMMEIGMAQQNTKLTAEQIDAARKFTEKYGAIMGMISAPIASLFLLFLTTAIIFGLMKLFKGEGKFKQYLSIMGYAYVIGLLYLALSAAVSFVTGNLMLDASLSQITNLFLPDIKGSYLYGIFRSIELFGVWQYIVAGMGIALLSKVGKVKVYSMVFLIYFATILYQANSFKLM